jgi:hypothetical protein
MITGNSFGLPSIALLIMMGGVLSSCVNETVLEQSPEEQLEASSLVSPTTTPWLAYVDNNFLYLVDPVSQTKVPLTELPESDLPTAPNLDSFKVSQDRNYVVWHAASKGIVAFDVKAKQLKLLYKSSEWFNFNPYFMMDSEEPLLYMVENKGTEFIQISLNEGRVNSTIIPSPFGSRFFISPDRKWVLFASGYEQMAARPEYLLLRLESGDYERIKTEAELADRFAIAWRSDSAGLFTIERGREIVYYDLGDLLTGNVFTSLTNDERAINLVGVDGVILVQTRLNNWYGYNDLNGNLTTTIPAQIAEEMQAPRIIPINNSTVYIEESFSQEDQKFKRLWISDLHGIKKMVLPKYYVSQVVSPLELEEPLF